MMTVNQKNIKPGQQDDFLRYRICYTYASQDGSGLSCL